MLTHLTEITLETLRQIVAVKRMEGFRFVTMTCTDLGDAHDVIYHFDKDYELHNMRLRLPHGTALPSISMVYFAAAIIENEIQDLFGIKVADLGLNYGGRFILSEGAPHAPFNKASAATTPAQESN